MTLADIHNFFFADATIAVVSWIGTAAAIIGLTFTYIEARRANISAKDAKTAVQALSERINIANVAIASAELEHLRGLIQEGKLPHAQILFGSFKRYVSAACRLLSEKPELKDQIPSIKKGLGRAQKQLDLGAQSSPEYKPKTLLAALNAISVFLHDQEQELKFRS